MLTTTFTKVVKMTTINYNYHPSHATITTMYSPYLMYLSKIVNVA